jgi:transposase-like protein
MQPKGIRDPYGLGFAVWHLDGPTSQSFSAVPGSALLIFLGLILNSINSNHILLRGHVSVMLTLSRILNEERRRMDCPHCTATTIRKRAKKNKLGYATFFCSQCQSTFNERADTPFNPLEVPTDIVLLAVLWRLRYKLSLRDVAELFLERGFALTHETVRDWETRFAPMIADQLRTKR